MTDIHRDLKPPLAQLLLALADDKLILGHRCSDWTGLGPILEEDIAFSHLAQDEIAHAQAIYELAVPLLGTTADLLAFGRPTAEYRCAHIVEVPDEFDWATALARRFYCDHFDMLRLGRMAGSSWKPLADLANRMAAEERLHVEHVDGWMDRLGRASEDSRRRMQRALDALAPLAAGLFEPFNDLKQLVDAGIYPGSDDTMTDEWSAAIMRVVDRAGLTAHIEFDSVDRHGGRRGVHTSHLAELLDEMCEVWRLEPNASW